MKANAELVFALLLLCCTGDVAAAENPSQTVPASAEESGATTAIAAIEQRMDGLRELAADKKGPTIKAVALDIRALPASATQLELAIGLSWVCTEGDPGIEALQGVADALEQVLRHEPAITSTNEWADAVPALARLVHFEGVKTTLKSPRFLAEIQRLEELDQKLATADFTLKDLDGKSWTLKALRGKVVLVNFWATWCPPCRAELPDLKALAADYPRDLIILGISTETEEELRPFVKKEAIKYPILSDADSKVSKEFGVLGIPRTMIYDRTGKLAAQAADMRTRTQLDALLARAGLTQGARAN